MLIWAGSRVSRDSVSVILILSAGGVCGLPGVPKLFPSPQTLHIKMIKIVQKNTSSNPVQMRQNVFGKLCVCYEKIMQIPISKVNFTEITGRLLVGVRHSWSGNVETLLNTQLMADPYYL
jgi:hypothetical protein